jgi:hypothetical protein
MLRRSFLFALLAPLLHGATVARGDKKSGGRTGIEWHVTPPEVVIWLDRKKLGEASSLSFTAASPGTHAVRMTRGGDRTDTQVKVTRGQVVRFEFDFGSG